MLQITGLGYPSLACRALVCQLQSALSHADAATEHGATASSPSPSSAPTTDFELFSDEMAALSSPPAPDVQSVVVAGVFDYNPHGADILMCYKFGSVRAGLESALYTVPDMRWIGTPHHNTQCAGLIGRSLFARAGLHWDDIQQIRADGANAFGSARPSAQTPQSSRGTDLCSLLHRMQA